MKNKLIIGTVGVFLALVCFLLFSNKIHYDIISRVEPEDLSATDYVKLEPGQTVQQAISIRRGVGYLKDIEVILINLSDETEDAVLDVILRNEKARVIKKAKYTVKQADAGRWVGIPIGKTYIQDVSIRSSSVYRMAAGMIPLI